MLKYISTYYALQQMSNDPWSGQARARSALTRLAGHMALCFRDYLYMASLGESRHASNRIGYGFEGFYGESRSDIFSRCTEYACSDANLERLVSLFEMSGWGSSYGGKKWATLSKLAGQYGKLSDALFVDAVINAQHNGGTAFNKTEASMYMDIDFSNSGLSYLGALLNYRRNAPNYIQLAYLNANGAKLTLSCGRLAMLYSAEKGFSLDIGKFKPIEEGSYKPVEWGDEDLPPLVKRKIVEEEESDDDGDEDKEEVIQRCPVCLQILTNGLFTTNCGVTVHSVCWYDHCQVCPDCHKEHPDLNEPKVNRCIVCHHPLIGLNSTEVWSNSLGGKNIHKHCYWMLPEQAFDEEQIEWSKSYFDNIAYECTLCHLPALAGDAIYSSDDKGFLHEHCWRSRGLSGAYGKICDCEDCQTKNTKWKELLDDHPIQIRTIQAKQDEVHFGQQEADGEVHEYEVSAQGHHEIKVQIKEQVHDPVEFHPADDDTASQCHDKLADYVHASPAVS